MSDFTSAERSTEEHPKAVFGYIAEGEAERKGIYWSGVAYQLPFLCLNVIMMKLRKNISPFHSNWKRRKAVLNRMDEMHSIISHSFPSYFNHSFQTMEFYYEI